MPRYTNNLNIFSSNGKYESEMELLYREQLRKLDIDITTENTQTFIIGERLGRRQDYTHSDILKDYGKGRISKGLRSLELLSILCSGVNHDDLFLFDRTIYSGDVATIKNSSDLELTNMVLINLGMVECINNLPEPTTRDYRDLCLAVGKNVRDGSYQTDRYKTYIMKESKKLMKMYLGISK